ncbi:MAG: small acid-soluble spore protein SspI [bacterium]|jgi:small acid-soluble spore protein sspI|nr:small acid-soluble spore protein SspI [bacterium]
MDLSIRSHIINNFKGDNFDELKRAIDESIAENDEETLPGMGVFLELIWQGADDKLKQEMLSIIKEKINSSN